jgi:hypothetical protein
MNTGSWVFFTPKLCLPVDSAILMTYSVSDRIVSFTPALTTFSRSSLSDDTGSWGFSTPKLCLPVDSVILMTYSVSDRIVTFTPSPTPCPRLGLVYYRDSIY